MHPPTHPPTPANAQALARQMPKVLLHEHLDGGLRVQTLFELLADRGLVSPAPDVMGLARWFDEHAFSGQTVELGVAESQEFGQHRPVVGSGMTRTGPLGWIER